MSDATTRAAYETRKYPAMDDWTIGGLRGGETESRGGGHSFLLIHLNKSKKSLEEPPCRVGSAFHENR